MSELHSYRGECDLILEQLAVALGHLEELREKYVKVSTKTNALHEACEHLLAEQVGCLYIQAANLRGIPCFHES